MGFARSRRITVTADGSANFTPWCSCRLGGVVTIEGSLVGTTTLQRRGADNVTVDVTNNSGTVTTFTANGTYTLAPSNVQAEYRLNMKSGAYTSGTGTLMIEGK